MSPFSSFMNQDKEELQHLISLCEEKGDITQKERHLASLCKLLIARIVDEPIAVADWNTDFVQRTYLLLKRLLQVLRYISKLVRVVAAG